MNDLSRLIGVSIKSIRTEINKLKHAGIITRIGPDKGGYWQVKIVDGSQSLSQSVNQSNSNEQ